MTVVPAAVPSLAYAWVPTLNRSRPPATTNGLGKDGNVATGVVPAEGGGEISLVDQARRRIPQDRNNRGNRRRKRRILPVGHDERIRSEVKVRLLVVSFCDRSEKFVTQTEI